MNIVYLLGNIGADVTVRQSQNGNKIASVSMATNKNVKVDGQWQNKSTWHQIVAFGKIAERLAQLRKGEQVFIVGEITVEQWQSQDGQQRTATKVYVSKVTRAQELKPESQVSSQAQQENYSTPPF